MPNNVKTIIEVCVGLHCSINGAYSILESIRSHYDLQIGIPSDDGMLLKEMECMHNCHNAVPVVINGIECTKSSLKNVIRYIEAIHIRKR